jgi:glycosyltransferase involved in cell wall biosynthesis
MDKNPVLLSICCITYNHENYISQAIEGFLAQKTSFNFEIIIHDDASTDATASIVKKYEQEHPNLIKAIYQTENQYSKGIKPWPNFVFPIARGKYIALCEGDDYWTDPYKLQKQVDFLEHNKDYSICFHDVKINKHGELINDDITRDVPESTSIIELAKGNYMHTPSVVFKRNWQELPSWFALCPAGDYPLHMINAQFGKIKKLDEVMAVYRIHNSNIWANQDNFRMSQNIHAYLHEMIDNFESGANEILKSRYLNITRNLIKKCLELNQRETANYYLTRLVEKHPDSVLKSFLSDLQPPSTKVLAKALLDQVNYKVRNYFFKKKNA